MRNLAEVTTGLRPNFLTKGLGFFILLVSFIFAGDTAAQVTCPGDGSTTDLACGLTGWWKLNAESGTTASDSSGNGINGTLCSGIYGTSITCPIVSAPTWYTGTKENALTLNGSNTTNGSGQLVLIPNPSANISAIQPSQAITVSLWVYPTVQGQEQTLFEMNGSYGIEIAGYNQDTTFTKFVVLLGTSGHPWNTIPYTSAVGGPINFNQWNHVVMTYTSGNLILYVNGALAASDTSITGPIIYPSSNNSGVGGTSIGAGLSWGVPSTFSNGNIDDVRIYNRVLSSTEIASIIADEPHDTSPPTLSTPAPQPGTTTSSSVTIDYNTTPSSTSQISYSTTNSLYLLTPITCTPTLPATTCTTNEPDGSTIITTASDNSNTSHGINLANLSASTTYYYTVTAVNSLDSTKISTSPKAQFTTGSAADNQTINTNENTAVNIDLLPSSDTTTPRKLVTLPTLGSLQGPNNSFCTVATTDTTTHQDCYVYTPFARQFGTDTFTYQAGSNAASIVTVNVNKKIQIPVWTDTFPNIVYVIQPTDSGYADNNETQNFQIPVKDINGDTLTYAITGLPANTTYNSSTGVITASGLGPNILSQNGGLIAGNVIVTVSNAGNSQYSISKTVNIYVRAPSDWYVAQNTVSNGPGAIGSSCANPESVDNWLNAHQNASIYSPSVSWGSGAIGVIGPGDTVHLCGIITSPITVQGSGVANFPITIYFEPNAKLSAPYQPIWINAQWQDWITIDGGTNGIIENTDNGTAGAINPFTGNPYSNYQQSLGIFSEDHDTMYGNDITIRNLIIQNLYVRTPHSMDPFIGVYGTTGIFLQGSNINISHVTVTQAESAIAVSISDMSNITIDSNLLTAYNHGISLAGGVGSSLSNAVISNNVLDGFDVYEQSDYSSVDLGFHRDSIFPFTDGVESYLYIFHNRIGPGWNPQTSNGGTAAIYLDGCLYYGTFHHMYVFNNIFALKSPLSYSGSGGGIDVHDYDSLAANNTLVAGGGQNNISVGGVNSAMYNNITYNSSTAVSAGDTSTSNFNINYNIYADINASGTAYGIYDSSTDGTPIIDSDFVQWQYPNTPFDQYSSTSDPGFVSTTFDPQTPYGDFHLVYSSSSPAIGKGKNLSSYCTMAPSLQTLCQDWDGNPRPATGNWDIGAYQYAQTLASPSFYNLSVAVAGTGPASGAVAAAGAISCGQTCLAQIKTGTTVTLTEEPYYQSSFAGWSGVTCNEGSQIENTCTVTMNSTQTVTAIFITSSGTPAYGDANGDGQVTLLDAEVTARQAIGLSVSPFIAANVEVDGTGVVDIYDAFLIAEDANGKITKFPVQQ